MSRSRRPSFVVVARCRFCGDRVRQFGDVCRDCDDFNPSVAEMARDDSARLMARSEGEVL